MLTVVALGGNAFSKDSPRLESERLKEAAEDVMNLLADGKVVITHGNGPQVGALYSDLTYLSLWEGVACTQGWMGASLAHVIDIELRERGYPFKTVVVITRVVTDPSEGTLKPVGLPLDERKVLELRATGSKVMTDSRGRLRRAVLSPQPQAIVEIDAIKTLLNNKFIVICCGGGGIPLVGYERIEAVVDKDLASQVLANSLGADRLIILTDTDFVYLDYGTAKQRPIWKLTVDDALKLYSEGQFGEGSMAPKVLAAARFVRNGGKVAFIGRLGRVREILSRNSGTEVVP